MANIPKKFLKYFELPAETPHIKRPVKHCTAFAKVLMCSKKFHPEVIYENFR